MAEQALRTFTSLGDRYGSAQAGAVLGRALVMAGRVEEGFALLLKVGTPEQGDARTAVGDGMPARFARLAAALQIGEPHRGASVLEEMEVLAVAGLGGDDGAAVLAAAALMGGDVAAAEAHLTKARPLDLDPNVMAVRALVAAASGTGEAGRLADQVEDATGATYLDRAIANVAACLEAAAGDAGAGEAQRRLSIARTAVQGTEDRVAKTVVELGAAAMSSRLALPEADQDAARAEHLAAKIGIDPAGWSRVFALATRAVTT
jgi:hypothetical protein